MECYVCGRGGQRRGFRILQLQNIPEDILNAAVANRAQNGLAPFGAAFGEARFHQNCYRNILRGIEHDNDSDNEEGPVFNCITQRRDVCFICQRNRNHGFHVPRVAFDTRVHAYLEEEVFIPKHAICCHNHYDENGCLPQAILRQLPRNQRHVPMSSKEITDWFHALREATLNRLPNHYSSEEHFDDEDFHTLTKIRKDNFRDLFGYCENVEVFGRGRTIAKKDLMAFLMKLTQDLSDAFIKVVLTFPSRQAVSLAITKVMSTLSGRFIGENIGPASITREEFIREHVSNFANVLYNPNPNYRSAILYVDGTYLKVEKSSNFRTLRQSYCAHKGYHLIKPALVVAPDGYILDVHGPYFSDNRNNDAAMLIHQMEQDEPVDNENLRTWLQDNDLFIFDRGYRDAVDFLNNLNVGSLIPPHLQRGERQLSTEDANKSRLITKTRWIVEARNGHLKNIFKFFKSTIQHHHILHLGALLRIACAMINRYFPAIEMEGANAELAQRLLELSNSENVVRARVEQEGLLRPRRLDNDRWIDLDQLNLPDFPVLPLDYLRDLTAGIYQVKLASSYIQDRLQREHVEHFTFQSTLVERGFLRSRMYSRFTQSVKHQVFIAYRSHEQGQEGDYDDHQPIIGYYCTCKTGSRTVGCCAHVASILWYLGYARHEAIVKYPTTKILHAVADASNRPLPPR